MIAHRARNVERRAAKAVRELRRCVAADRGGDIGHGFVAGDGALRDAIRQVCGRGGIVIIIAHRAGALADVDQMMVLRGGSVALLGPREAVLAKVGRPALSDPGPAAPTICAATDGNRQSVEA